MHFAEQGEFAFRALLARIREEAEPAPLGLDHLKVIARDSTGPVSAR
jgi:hypothetical protein